MGKFELITIALAAVAIATAVWAALYQRQPPKRRLTVIQQRPTSLLAESSSSVSDLAVTRHGKVIGKPYIARVVVRNTGKRDVDSDQFDDARPILIDFGSDVVDLVDVVSFPRNLPPIRHNVQGSQIELGPDLIRRGQSVTVQALIDGSPTFQLRHHVKDTKVDVEVEGQESSRSLSVWRGVVIVGPALISILVAVLAALMKSAPPEPDLPPIPTAAVSVTGGVAAGTSVASVQGQGFPGRAKIRFAYNCIDGQQQVHVSEADDRGNASAQFTVKRSGVGQVHCLVEVLHLKSREGFSPQTFERSYALFVVPA